MHRLEKWNSEDLITIDLFGKKEQLDVLYTEDNKFDEKGNDKKFGFALTDDETA